MRQEMLVLIAALNRTESDLTAYVYKSQSALDRIEKARRFYKQMDLLLDLISRYNTEELIALLDHR